ncbi:formate dehydrogenase accessory sulfurtransferase FdhD [Nocardioides sp. Bht2]|uniref:formate dehydrogenase accessory sulfurtransferase FdhD n=1 Tax=Nocardioides sp. Bht2 TaxID=3392297 RepID=UPI0039B5124F
MGLRSQRRSVLRVRAGRVVQRPDALAVEEPLEIRVDGAARAITMRTPGDDFELAAGFLLAEGVISGPDDVVQMRYCDDGSPDPQQNIVDVTLHPEAAAASDLVAARRNLVTSACGICGRESLDEVRMQARWSLADDPAQIALGTLLELPERLRAGQAVFERTGGLHAAALFTAAGELLVVREDVGRHNAVDKVIGWALTQGRVPARGLVLQVSGRISFELVQKAWLAGVPVFSAVSAPSSLAVDLAQEAGMTLAGFVRDEGLNLYAGAERVSGAVPA